MNRYAFYINTSVSSGCKTCQAACRDKNNLGPGVNWRRVYEVEGGEWKQEKGAFVALPFSYFISLSCQNCNSPECVKACPTTAMHINAIGITEVKPSLCIGCRYCEWACPYGAPQYDQLKKAITKCNLCEDLIIKGFKPSCVDACPMRALDFGTYEEMTARYGKGGNIFPLPDPSPYEPGMVLNPHRYALQAEDKHTSILKNENE